MTDLSFMIYTSSNTGNFLDMIAYISSKFPDLIDAGISGYVTIVKDYPIFTNIERTLISGISGKLVMLNLTNEDDIMKLVKPIFDHINSTWVGFTAETNTRRYESFYDWFKENYDPTLVGRSNLVVSRLLSRQALSANITATKSALETFLSAGHGAMFLTSGKGVKDAKPRGGGNAACPAWRDAYAQASKFE
jgi:hypothetical protein